jgi:dTDP-4-amino-4,6-dideoxygalactose transaminase
VRGQENLLRDWSETTCAPNANVEALRLQLNQAGIETRPLWKPMHLQPLYHEAPFYGGHEPVSESLFKTGLCLPSGPRVAEEDVRFICNMIGDLCR